MEYWEFLLQQEGDQSWLPLDTAQMEILEGRYRIMAHTSQGDVPVQIQISQRLLDQVPPKRRSLKRQGRTTAEGLLVVMPFTRLRPGTWDVQCSSLAEPEPGPEPTTDKTSPWRYAIQLQVLPPGSGDDEFWELPSAGAMPESVVYGAGGASISESVSDPPAPAQPLPQPVTAETATPLDLDLAQLTAALNQAQADLATGEAIQGWLHRLTLHQSALVGHEAGQVTMAGQVAGVQPGEATATLALGVRLSDPQTAEAVALSSFALASPTLPAAFNLAIAIPANLSTRLLLGEISLVTVAEDRIAVLALQRFTVTVDLASLFDAIANQGETEADLSVTFPTPLGDPERDRQEAEAWANVDLPTGPPRSVPSFTLPRSGLKLPPRIYYPSPHEVSARRPTLPPFGDAKVKERSRDELPTPPEAIPSDMAADEPPPASSAPTSEVIQPAIPTETSSADTAARSALSLPPLASPRPATPDPPAAKPPTPLLPSHESAGFRDLKLEDRFWSRLNDMAVTLQQEARQRQSAAAPPSVSDSPRRSEDGETVIPAFAGEVVIYEDEDETLGSPSPDSLAPVAEEDIVGPPEPELEVPSGELIAGDSVLLTLRVPFHANRLYLKVWITDLQTRSLVDEPRQIMHLIPNGRGQLEGSLQLTVPQGCLEAQFEAIAVDMITQQESYKATVSRTIVPPGLPDADDLGL